MSGPAQPSPQAVTLPGAGVNPEAGWGRGNRRKDPRPWLVPRVRARNLSETRKQGEGQGQKDSVALPVPGWGDGVFKPSLGSRPAAGEAAKLGAGQGGESRHPPQRSHESSAPMRCTQGGFCVGIGWKKTCTDEETTGQTHIAGHPAKHTGPVPSPAMSTAGQRAPSSPLARFWQFPQTKIFSN